MCLSAVGSCFASACAGCCCYGLSDCHKIKYGPLSRIPYVFLMFACCFFAVCMSLFGEKVLYKNDLLNIELSICNNEQCVGNGAIYRTSFTLFIFYVIHALVVSCVLPFHYMFFIIKFFSLVIVLTATFWIPNTVFSGWSQFARVGSFFFLLVQIYVLINWAWDFNDKLSEKINEYEVSEKEESGEMEAEDYLKKQAVCCFKFALIGGTLFLLILVITAFVLFFKWFTPTGNSCSLQTGLIIVSIILVITIFILSIVIPGGSIFTTGVVSFYCTYLLYAGLEAHPDATCNTFAASSSTLSMWVGIIITSVAISYTGFSVSYKLNENNDNDDENPNEINMALPGDNDEDKDKTKKEDNPETAETDLDAGGNYVDVEDNKDKMGDYVSGSDKYKAEQKANVIFYICMGLSSLYIAMLYTSWGEGEYSLETNAAKVRGKMSFWVNIGAQWVTMILYVWTLIAPKVCPSRFDGEEENEDE